MTGERRSGAVHADRVPVLVTDGEQHAALAVTRSLGAAGFPVYVASHRPHSLSASSRFCKGSALLPDPLEDSQAYATAAEKLLARWAIRVLMPITDASLLALLPRRGRFADVVIPFGDAAAHRALSDKSAVLAAATELGIAVPQQYVMRRPEELDSSDFPWSAYPVVLKPARSVASIGTSCVKVAVSYADSADELRERLRAYPPAAFPILLQERVAGTGMGIFILRWGGVVHAVFAHRRLREKPPAGGISVWCESIDAPPALMAQSISLIERFDWAGVAMVEYKYNEATGVPTLMEVNGRFWGSLQLAIDAGVDFPLRLVRAACGAPLEDSRDYRRGVRMHSWWGSVDHLIARLRSSPQKLSLPPGAPSRARILADLVALCAPWERGETLRANDPRPFVRETVNWLIDR